VININDRVVKLKLLLLISLPVKVSLDFSLWSSGSSPSVNLMNTPEISGPWYDYLKLKRNVDDFCLVQGICWLFRDVVPNFTSRLVQ